MKVASGIFELLDLALRDAQHRGLEVAGFLLGALEMTAFEREAQRFLTHGMAVPRLYAEFNGVRIYPVSEESALRLICNCPPPSEFDAYATAWRLGGA